MNAPNILLLLPEHLRAPVERAAQAEATTPEAWVERAVARQLDEGAWRDVVRYGERQAAALGYTEDDVERLIAELRGETRSAEQRTAHP